jgi:hypothetical protein
MFSFPGEGQPLRSIDKLDAEKASVFLFMRSSA